MKKASVILAWARGLSLALALLAAGTCLVAGRALAQGTIVHVVPPQPIPYSDFPSSQDIDLNGDGVPDFNLSSPNSFDINLSPLNNNAIISVPEPPGDLGAFIYAFNQGHPHSTPFWCGGGATATSPRAS